MEMHEIAVVIPVYNAQRYLKQCVKSVLYQSFGQFCLILVDDGSTDKSGDICDLFAQRDKRVHVIHQKNKGSVESRKAGVLSKWAQESKYVFMSDADDVLEKDALKKLYETAEINQLDCVCGRMVKMWKGIPVSQSVSQSVVLVQ